MSIPRGAPGSKPVWFIPLLPYLGQKHDQGNKRCIAVVYSSAESNVGGPWMMCKMFSRKVLWLERQGGS